MINKELPGRWQNKKRGKVKRIKFRSWTQGFSKSRVALVLFCVFLCYFGVLFVNQMLKMNEMDSRLAELKMEIEEVKRYNEELEREVELLHNYEYIETLARKELGLIKSGEVLFNVDNNRYVFQEKQR